MKIFSWMQNKFNGRFNSTKHKPDPTFNRDTQKEVVKQEFSDLPDGLLTIGTLGNNNDLKKEDQSKHKSAQEDHFEDLTPEEVQKIQNQLNILLHKQHSENPNDDSIFPGKGKGIFVDSTSKAINKKFLKFLLKKMFVCGGGFSPAPAPSLRDQVPESRMEKILRAILHKKIYPQNPSSNSVTKKYFLENKHETSTDHSDDDEDDKDDDNGSKWVKTDSEYIVLEI